LSDHRPCYVESYATLLLGTKVHTLVSQKHRQLQLHDPRIVESYNTILSEQLSYHKIPDKLEILKKQVTEGHWSTADQEEYNKIDQLIMEAMLHAERSSTKKYSGPFVWSHQLIKMVQGERYWKLRLKQSKGLLVSAQVLHRIQKAADIQSTPDHCMLPTIISQLRDAAKKRREAQKQHKQLRETYLERLASAIVLKKSPQLEDPDKEEQLPRRTKEAILRIIKKECKQSMYRAISTHLKPTGENSTGTMRIDVPAPPSGTNPDTIDPKSWKGPWWSVTDPNEIGFYICKTNTKQYNQAEKMPFGSGTLADELYAVVNCSNITERLHSVLMQTTNQELLRETRDILQYLAEQYPQPMGNASHTITPKEFVDTYSRVKEKKSSSLSGRKVGHYKAVLDNPFLVGIHSVMMSIPYQTGFSPPQWHHVVDVMLEKVPGNPKQHRPHMIALLESDYNQSQRILVARPMNHRLEDNGMLPDIQYGSRSGRECISPVLNKVLT
jgi:hypothetical protein